MSQKNRFYILIRKDLDVSIGKLMVHMGHLCTEMAWQYLRHDERPDLRAKFEGWYFYSQQTKILLSVDNLEELMKIRNRARLELSFMTFMVKDAGFTKEVERGTVLMLGIEPVDKVDAEAIGLDSLELYK